mmetsp:Transcript_118252/g.339258  ORF Transcript_118252/g.339258 Transcript_118252/m.339258 type:complete len:223 (-) Transcript_118252:750-1418(-)
MWSADITLLAKLAPSRSASAMFPGHLPHADAGDSSNCSSAALAVRGARKSMASTALRTVARVDPTTTAFGVARSLAQKVTSKGRTITPEAPQARHMQAATEAAASLGSWTRGQPKEKLPWSAAACTESRAAVAPSRHSRKSRHHPGRSMRRSRRKPRMSSKMGWDGSMSRSRRRSSRSHNNREGRKIRQNVPKWTTPSHRTPSTTAATVTIGTATAVGGNTA